ncbi:aa3-type cytochrome c oxidase subunit IV [Algihabitans albus]|uniref:aa3-type cytochrome c oxidase subunit IV n=1 Tax=Algihabitans albus TaxID=2164067 RepID=UPI0035D0297A
MTEKNEDPMANDDTFHQELLANHQKVYEGFIKNSVRGTVIIAVIVALVVGFAIVG